MRSTACGVTPAVCEMAKLILRARGPGISPSNAAALVTSSFDRTTAAISVVSASSSFNSSFSSNCVMRPQGSSNNRTPASCRRRRAVSFVIFPSSRRSADPSPPWAVNPMLSNSWANSSITSARVARSIRRKSAISRVKSACKDVGSAAKSISAPSCIRKRTTMAALVRALMSWVNGAGTGSRMSMSWGMEPRGTVMPQGLDRSS